MCAEGDFSQIQSHIKIHSNRLKVTEHGKSANSVLLMDITAMYNPDLSFHTDKTAIDGGHIYFFRWQISTFVKCIRAS